MFSIAKIFFFIIQGTKSIIIKEIIIPAKIFEPATSWSPSLYSTAAPLKLRHYTPLGMIQLVSGGDPHFQSFFSEKGVRVRTKEKIRV
jgi:hypothetical protein